MSNRPILLALALALAFALPAAADHVFSHRVYVVGRVLDAEGLPAASLPVNLTFHGWRVTGRCFDSKPEVTSPTGDFQACRHTHEIPANVTVTVRVGGAEQTVSVDPDLRHASASFQLDAPAPRDIHGVRTFERTLLVTGRTFEILAAVAEEEGVNVSARPIGENLTIKLQDGPEVLANVSARPDEHGLYRAEIPIEEIPAGATVQVFAGLDGTIEVVPDLFRRADVNVVRDLSLSAGQPVGAPGSSTPWGAWLALAALTLAAAVAARAPRRGRAR